MGDATVRTPEEEARRKNWKHVIEWLDVIAKLFGGIAIVLVAYAANAFQSKMTRITQENQNRTTMITLQSQREQAESPSARPCSATSSGPSPVQAPDRAFRPIAKSFLSNYSP